MEPAAARRGISLLDLFDLTAESQPPLPADIAAHFEGLAVINYFSTTSKEAYVHHGVVQSIGEGFAIPGIRDWDVEIPGINSGLPFQLTMRRVPQSAPDASHTLEPKATDFQLDLLLNRVSITIPGLRPAVVRSTPGEPTRLVGDPSRDKVRIVGGAILRVKSVEDNISLHFIDAPDPFDLDAPVGALFSLTFDPPSFFIGDSEYGLTVNELLYDDSSTYTPAPILARGQTPEWRGLSIRETTVYMPPSVGHLSAGVRDLLLGSPVGMQGKIIVEFGRLSIETINVHFDKVDEEDPGERRLSSSGTGQLRSVQLGESSSRIRGIAEVPDLPGDDPRPPGQTYEGLWILPDPPPGGGLSWSTEQEGLETTEFTVRPGDVVRFRGREKQGDEVVQQYPEIVFTFEQSGGDGQPAQAPHINLTPPGAGSPIEHVLHIAGTAAAMNDLAFEAPGVAADAVAHLRWKLQTGQNQVDIAGATTNVTPLLPGVPGEHFLILKDNESGAERRVLVEVREEGALLIGAADGVHDAAGSAVPSTAVGALFALDVFHHTGHRTSAQGQRPALSDLTVPENRIVEVTVPAPGNPPDSPLPGSRPDPILRSIRGIEEFETGETNIPAQGLDILDDVAQELATPDTFAIIVGRTDDLWRSATDDNQRQTKNQDLARNRAQAVYSKLTGLSPGISDRVFRRGEQDLTDTWIDESLPADGRDALPPEAREETWLIRDRGDIPGGLLDSTAPRPSYRRVDVYLIRPPGSPGADPSPGSSNHRQVLLPGADPAARPQQPPADTSQADPGGYRFRLIAEWDSPTLVALEDGIPTMAEVLIEWKGDQITLPARTDPQAVNLNTEEVYAILGRWSYDARSGETLFSLSVRSVNDPNGLFPPIENTGLAVAFGVGPALISALDPEPGVGFVAFAALISGAEFLTELQVVRFREGKLAVLAITAEQRFANQLAEEPGTRTRVLLDYTVEFGVSVGLPPLTADPDLELRTKAGKPVKIKYKNVGIELVWDDEGGVESFNGVFDGTDLEIVDPGGWELGGEGGLADLFGQLLRVDRIESGTGSIWFDFHLKLALDLGIITVTGAVVRVIFPMGAGGDVDVELRGLGLKFDIPETLKGEGMLAITPSGGFSANIAIQVIPAKVEATGAVSIIPAIDEATGDGYTHSLIELGLILPAGIPLGGSGVALYGFVGRFVANGRRLISDSIPDPVKQEINWHAKPANQKYGPDRGQWAIGLGAVVGTMPDSGYSFNALGMFAISFPTISVVFSIDAKFASAPSTASEDREELSEGDISLKILGLVAIDSEAVKIGIRGTFKIEKVLELFIPISAFFPINRQPTTPDAYLRIGSDGVNPASLAPPPTEADLDFYGFERFGSTVTLKLLPDSLNVEAWAFNMFEHRILAYLGGEQDLGVLTGFSIGFGAGFTIDWSAGPLRLYATAKVLLGMGTKPIMLVGGIFVRGGLSLVILTIEISGKLLFRVWEDAQYLKGEFCGKVSMLFFSIKGCVGVEIGAGVDIEIPDPDPLIPQLDLTDRRGTTTGTAVLPTDETPSPEEPVVWIDTVPVVQFQHNVTGDRNAEEILVLDGDSNFALENDPGVEPLWSGTSELKYSYRLLGVELWRHDSTDWQQETGTFPAGWWWPWHRPGLIDEEDSTPDGKPTPSEHEGRQLALMNWHPQPTGRVLIDGGAGTDGDPADTISRICEPTPELEPVCALGKNAKRTGYDSVVLRPNGPGPAPYFNTFDIFAHEGLPDHSMESTNMLVDGLGMYLRPGEMVPISNPLARGGAYRISSINRYARFFSTLQFEATYAPRVVDPDLRLALGNSPLQGVDEPVLGCTDFENVPVFSPSHTFALDKWIFESGSPMRLQVSPTSGRIGLRAEENLAIAHEEGCQGLKLTLEAHDSEMTILEIMVADDSGQLVDSQTVLLTGTAVDIEFSAPSIMNLEMKSLEGTPFLLTKICCGHIPEPSNDNQDDLPEHFHDDVLSGVYDDLFPGTGLAHPRVLGILPGGGTEEWPSVEVGADSDFTFVDYTAPHRGPWIGFRIESWRERPVYVVSSCANTKRASDQHDNDAGQRDILPIILTSVLFDDHPLLEPDARYQVRVRYEWNGWVKSEESDTPPDEWDTLGSETAVFTFRTAPFMPNLPDDPPVNLLDEALFDPHGAVRYFAGFEVNERFHFYEDPLYAHVKVKYLTRLFEKYGYELRWEIRRTDMPAGSRSPTLPPEEMIPLEVPLTETWGLMAPELLEMGDRRIREAGAAAGCLDDIPVGGATGTLDAELGPRHQYDALLLAIPPDDSPELVVARQYFATSRYASPRALLEVLGFGPLDAPSFRHPIDLVAPGSLPPGGVLGNDADLEHALSQLGLDPFPMAGNPRTILLWSREEGAEVVFRLIAIMLEADEPLQRAMPVQDVTRLDVVEAAVVGGGENISFMPRFGDASFTRLILTPGGGDLADLTHTNLQSLGDLTLRLTLRQEDKAQPSDEEAVETLHEGSVVMSGAPLDILEGE